MTQRSSIVTRTVLLTSAVAAIVVVVAGIASYPLIRATALTQAQGTLSRLADLTATALDRGPQGRGRDDEILPRALVETLRAEMVTGYLVFSADQVPPGVPAQDVLELLAGRELSRVSETPQGPVLTEGRPLATGGGVILEQPASVIGGTATSVLIRFAIALIIGLCIAIPTGFVVARRLTRPLRAARDAAYEMASGSRDVRVEPEGPSEIADIADSLNHLNSALANSEGRQREFLLSVSHEFRTPLTAVKGYGEALADQIIIGDEVPRTGAIVAAEAERLDRLVNDLLDLARLGAITFVMHPVDTDLLEIGQDAAAVWGDRCARDDVEFVAELPDAPLPVVTDPMRVRQIVDNLMENALRVAPAGTRIVLAVRIEGPWAVVEVRDSGPGLTADDIAAAFEPGVLHERYRGIRPVGTGLGLAMVGRLAAGLGGAAEAGRAAEGGARFTVRLPRSDVGSDA